MGVSDLCHICGKGPEDFVTLRQFKMHFKKHEGPVNCPVCTKEFASIIILQAHQRTHKNEIFNCDQCDKSFSRIDNLKKHKESHNIEKISISCLFCKKTFNNCVFSDSNYNVKDLSSDKHGEKLLAGVHHLNSYNLI